MEIKYEIPDDLVRNFTEAAKRNLQERSEKYTKEIISEAEKTEKLIRESGASTEITETNVFQAAKRYQTGKRKNLKITLVRILAEILLFLSGLMYLPEMLVTDGALDTGYFALFSIVTSTAIITTIVTHFMGGE